MTTLLTPFLTVCVWERRLACILMAVLMVGCGGETGMSGPPDGGGSELRPGLTLSVGVAPEAASVAQTLGWTGGVPGAEVRVHRFGTDFAWETATTDAQGVARLPDLITGRYRVAVYRPLTEAESAQTGVAALAGGRELDISAGGTENTLDVIPNQPGSLVISEVYATSPFVSEVRYDFHMYFELYNNSDQTVFLDGLTFGTTLGIPNISATLTCEQSAPFRKDPGGMWAHFLHRFPGSGAEFPLAPGGVAVVALDAVDHSTVDSRFPDMSHADFELFGSADVDNPDVPNVVEVGVEPFQLGHGLRFFISDVLFIARRVDPAALESQILTGFKTDEKLLRVPASDLIDVVWTTPNGAFNEQRFDFCDGPVHAIFDQLGGGFVTNGPDLGFSVQRIPLPGTGGARLQDTNVSAVDLVRARFTPGSVP